MTDARRLTPAEIAEYWRANRARWLKLDHDAAAPRPAGVVLRPQAGCRLESYDQRARRIARNAERTP